MYCITRILGQTTFDPKDTLYSTYMYMHVKQSFFTAKLSSAVVLRITTIFLATTTFDHLPLTCLL